MKAAMQTSFGSPDVLTVQEVPAPTLAADQILVRVHASAVTQGDRRLRAADYPFGFSALVGRLMFGLFRPRNPTPGTTFAGRVEQVGADVTRWSVGDDVFGSADHSAAAELLAVDADGRVAPLPSRLSYEEAAAAPYGAITALTFLRDMAKVRPGETLLVVGGAGGVGRYAVQVGKHLGARVTALVGTRDLALARELGADEVIDYRTQDATALGKRWDVIFDTSGKLGFFQARRALARKGRHASVYMTIPTLLLMLVTSLFGGRRTLRGVALGNAENTAELGVLLDQRAVRPVIAARFPLSQVREAHAALESGASGDVVITVAEPAPRARAV